MTVLTSDDIEAIGPEDGTELMENVAEQGLNYFSEAESDSGGVNSARGDVGAYNINEYWLGIENMENLKKVEKRVNKKNI